MSCQICSCQICSDTASCYFVTSRLTQQLRSRRVPEPDKTYVQGTFQNLESGDNCGWISNEIDGISTMSTSKALIADKSASCAWDRASSRTSNNWNRSIVGLPGSQSRTTVTEHRWRGNHAARPRLGNARRPKESRQAGHDVQDQQRAWTNNNTCSKVAQELETHSDFSKKVQTTRLSKIHSSQGSSSFHSGTPEQLHLIYLWALTPTVCCVATGDCR